ncbi:MAG TPA: GMC family oxidoreductase N-terminal domain-containing protein [Thermoanaerobaculia bacterium]|nr:GMC family oxidoreductase N-terminal domain-containing protein [Thermoanaerobaculia bacterium]
MATVPSTPVAPAAASDPPAHAAEVAEPTLSPAERQTLRRVCEAFVPALVPEAEDDPRLFALDADALGVAEEAEKAVATLPPQQRAEFRQLLRLLEQPAAMLLLAGRRGGFSALSETEREGLLAAMATSQASLMRRGFQALKRLATFFYYSAPGLPDGGGPQGIPGGVSSGVPGGISQDVAQALPQGVPQGIPQGSSPESAGEAAIDRSAPGNPIWEAIGYRPPTRPRATAAPLRITTLDRPAALDCDVCVIGSGAGGCVVAAEMAAAGHRVVVLEAGGGEQAPDYDQTELAGTRALFLDHGLAASRDLAIAIMAGATLGGGTAVNWQTSLCTPDGVREEWALLSGCPFFAEASFGSSLAVVERRLSVSTAESTVNPNNDMLRRGCAALGWSWTQVPRNSRGCDPTECGHCSYGCRLGGKQTAATTFLHDAQVHGETVVVTRCAAERVLWKAGKTIGVEARASDGAGRPFAVEVRCPIVVVAAGGIHSPAVLLRSGLELPALGRHLYLHPATGVAGLYRERIEPWSGPPQSILCDEFAQRSGQYGFRLEVAPPHPGMLAMATPWCGARDHRRQMQAAAFKSTIICLVRDRAGGRVRLGKDGRPVIDYEPERQERAFLREGIAAAARVHLAAGAHALLTMHSRRIGLESGAELPQDALDDFFARVAGSPVDGNWLGIYSAHQMGTCRMGSSAKSAVCNEDGEVFGVRGLFVADASAFPASSGVNPMITVMALAHHTAQRIKALAS